MSSTSRSFRNRSKTLPARVKIDKSIEHESKSRAPLPFRRLADLLKRKKRRGRADADSFNALALEKQAWYHGKITADFAERYLRRDGNFLVREDPAVPGTCFIVVRHKRAAEHIQLCKVNSSKGTRIKYKISDSDKSFDSISELINHHVNHKTPLSPNTTAVLTHAVSRDATLLSTDDFRKPPSNHNRYVTNTSPANLCPPKPPGTGPLRQRKLGRKNSDPGISPNNISEEDTSAFLFQSQNHKDSFPPDNLKWTTHARQREKIPDVFLQKAKNDDRNANLVYTSSVEENQTEELPLDASGEAAERFYDQPDEPKNPEEFYDQPREDKAIELLNGTSAPEENLECFYDKPSNENHDQPTEAENPEDFYDKPSEKEHAEAFYDTPTGNGEDNSLYDQPKHSQESLYDKPKASLENLLYDVPNGSQENLYDKPRTSEENLYDKPPKKPTRMPSFRNSDPTVSSKVGKFPTLRPQLVSRCSAPSLRAFAGASVISHLDRRSSSDPQSNLPPEKKHSGEDILLPEKPSRGSRDGTDCGTALEQIDCDEPLYSIPPKSVESLSSGASEERSYTPPLAQEDKGSTALPSPSKCSNIEEHSESARVDSEPSKPVDKQGIFLSVMKKIREILLLPFLECDCLSLARHMTRVDLSLLWGENPVRRSWTLEDGTGGAEGLEFLTLPQGREIRADLLKRCSDITNWVATLIVAAGDLSTREQVLTKLIELADILSDQLGNLVSFMAVMDGLCLPQVTRLHHTWSCLHHQHCSVAILYHSTLKPLASLLSSGAPSPFPGVCLPYMVPLVRYMEMTMEDILSDVEHTDADLGIGTLLAHLESGRILTQQLEEFRQQAASRLQTKEYTVDARLIEYFQNKLDIGNVLGLEPTPANRANKLRTLLQWLSENAERSAQA